MFLYIRFNQLDCINKRPSRINGKISSCTDAFDINDFLLGELATSDERFIDCTVKRTIVYFVKQYEKNHINFFIY